MRHVFIILAMCVVCCNLCYASEPGDLVDTSSVPTVEGDSSNVSSEVEDTTESVDESEEGEEVSEADQEPGESDVEGEGEVEGDDSIQVDTLTVQAGTVVLSSEEEEASLYAVAGPITGAGFIRCDTVELGEVVIYVPVDWQQGSFAKTSSGNLFNIRSSTISGIVVDGSDTLTFRCSSFSEPQYRRTGVSSYYDLTVREVLESNVQVVESTDELPLYPDLSMLILVLIALVGVIVVCRFLKQ